MSAPQALKKESETFKILQLLVTTKKVLNRNGIKWWLDYGTLLGATRSGKLIPWDEDCDISCMEKDKEQLSQLGPDFAARGFNLHTHSFNDTGYQVYPSDPISKAHLDIFTWYRDPITNLLRRRFYVGMTSSTGTDRCKGRDFPIEWVETLSEITLEGEKFPAPKNPQDFCKFRYGDSWKTPMTVGEFNRKVPIRRD